MSICEENDFPPLSCRKVLIIRFNYFLSNQSLNKNRHLYDLLQRRMKSSSKQEDGKRKI